MLEYANTWGFPFLEKIKESSATNKIIFSNFSKKEYYTAFIKEYMEEKIKHHSSTKMWKLFHEQFTLNKELFIKFMVLNINKNFNQEFNEVGERVKDILVIIENDLFKSVENSQYGKYSTWISNKYTSFIKSIFPYFQNVGVRVKVRNI